MSEWQIWEQGLERVGKPCDSPSVGNELSSRPTPAAFVAPEPRRQAGEEKAQRNPLENFWEIGETGKGEKKRWEKAARNKTQDRPLGPQTSLVWSLDLPRNAAGCLATRLSERPPPIGGGAGANEKARCWRVLRWRRAAGIRSGRRTKRSRGRLPSGANNIVRAALQPGTGNSGGLHRRPRSVRQKRRFCGRCSLRSAPTPLSNGGGCSFAVPGKRDASGERRVCRPRVLPAPEPAALSEVWVLEGDPRPLGVGLVGGSGAWGVELVTPPLPDWKGLHGACKYLALDPAGA